MFQRLAASSILLLVLVIVAVGCGSGGSSSKAGGLTAGALTREGDDSCVLEDALVAGLEEADLPTRLRDEDKFDPVILHDDSQDEADSADSTVLFDTDGAHLICRYRVGDDLRAEVVAFYFGAVDDRTGFEDAEASTYALDAADMFSFDPDEPIDMDAIEQDVEAAAVGDVIAFGSDEQPMAVVKVRAEGEGASAAICVQFTRDDGGEDEGMSLDSVETVAHTMAERLGRA